MVATDGSHGLGIRARRPIPSRPGVGPVAVSCSTPGMGHFVDLPSPELRHDAQSRPATAARALLRRTVGARFDQHRFEALPRHGGVDNCGGFAGLCARPVRS